MKDTIPGTPLATRIAAQHIETAREHCVEAREHLLDLLALASQGSDSVAVNLLLELNVALTGLSFELDAFVLRTTCVSK